MHTHQHFMSWLEFLRIIRQLNVVFVMNQSNPYAIPIIVADYVVKT